jgi:hypothetical protein
MRIYTARLRWKAEQGAAVGLTVAFEPRPDGSRLSCVAGAEYRHDKITGTIGDCARGIHKTSLVAVITEPREQKQDNPSR